MSLHSFYVAKRLHAEDVGFDALIMAALWRADSDNASRLREAWPDLCAEMRRRYVAPGGAIDGEAVPTRAQLRAAGLSDER